MSYRMTEFFYSNEWNIRLNVQVVFHSKSAMRIRKVGESESGYISF